MLIATQDIIMIIRKKKKKGKKIGLKKKDDIDLAR